MCETDFPVVSHYIIEIGAYIIALVLLWSAWKKGRFWLLTLLTGIVYGVILEILNMSIFHTYTYGDFLVMLPGDLPLIVGVSWGMIIYAAMLTSTALGVVWWIRPFMDALLALMIDLALDPVAANQGLCMWIWSPEEKPFLFGVPPDNYFGWFFVAFGFSLFWYILGRKFHPETQSLFKQIVLLVVNLILAMVVLFGAIVIFRVVTKTELTPMVIFLGVTLLISVILVLRFARPIQRDNSINVPVLLVPIYFYLYDVVAGFVWIQNTQMMLNTILWTVVAMACYLLPYSKTIFKR